MPARLVDVVWITTRGPGDVSGLLRHVETGRIVPTAILAILGKTEGNGGVNDFTREHAVSALCMRYRRISASPRLRWSSGSPSSCPVGRRGC